METAVNIVSKDVTLLGLLVKVSIFDVILGSSLLNFRISRRLIRIATLRLKDIKTDATDAPILTCSLDLGLLCPSILEGKASQYFTLIY